jgi:hypothetical protein
MNIKKIKQLIETRNCKYLLWILFSLISIDILYQVISFPAKNINQDNYYYISLGMLPEYCDITDLKDAFTVGIFPVLIFRFISWLSLGSGNYLTNSLILSKFIVIFCLGWSSYLCVISGGINKNSFGKILLLVMMFLGFKDVPDLLSLNAEYIAVGLIITTYFLINSYLNIFVKVIGYIALTLICVNTKLQSLPLLFAILIISDISKKNLAIYILILAAILSLNEYFLYNHKLGYLYNYKALLS